MELPKPQPQMMDIPNLRRPSTAPGIDGTSFGESMNGDPMQWLPGLPPTPFFVQFSTPAWQTFTGPATPSTLATASYLPNALGNDLSRYSLSIPNSAPASPR